MKKRGFVACWLFLITFLILLTISSPLALSISTSVESEIKKITHYAEEYETGNINYVQLVIYSSAVRNKLNELLGAEKIEGGLLKEEQLKSLFGEPTESTKWVWLEKEEREKKLGKEIPVWKKIIFDGNKIQIWLNAWPSIFGKEEKLIYRLNFEIVFKKPKDEFNINERISSIKELAEEFNKNPSTENAEKLAEESVNAEKEFESLNRQNQGKCQDTMNSIFGSENIREKQKLLVQEIEFFNSDEFELKTRLEMCDECEWNWVNLNFWFEGRGSKFKELKMGNVDVRSPESFKGMESSDFENAIKKQLETLRQLIEKGDYSAALALNSQIQALNEAWNQKSNDLWKEVESTFKSSRETLTQEQLEEFNRNYGWIREEQQKRELERKLRKENFEKRKNFYLDLFSSYEKKELYFEQTEYEKRLIEEFKEFGEEICDNNKDDNNNEQIDCSEEQCQGKICGKQEIEITENNETLKEIKELNCIAKQCQLKEEIIEEKKVVCGDHICEIGEEKNCTEDCSLCKNYSAIECSGKAIFKGKDENGCPLEPICLNETYFCEKNEDCTQPLCGKAECMENSCKVINLEECKEAECADGDEKVQNCGNGDRIVVKKCIGSLWRDTGFVCKPTEKDKENITSCEMDCITIQHPACIGDWRISGIYPDCNCEFVCKVEEPVSGDECKIKEDCGNEADVCSNGECVTIPKVIKTEPEQKEQQQYEPKEQEEGQEQRESGEGKQQAQQPEESEEEKQELQTEEAQQSEQSAETITAQIIKTIKSFTGKIVGAIISGFEVAEEQQPADTSQQNTEDSEQPENNLGEQPTEESQQPAEQQQDREEQRYAPREEQRDYNEERDEDDREQRERDNAERREKECDERCNGECFGRIITPCVDSCVRKAECKDEICVNNEIKRCEEECKKEKNIDSCVEECSDKCEKGEKFEIQEEKRDFPKEEKGVFKVGGTCRTSQQKTEAFIYFDGWGEPFDEIRYLKQKYYSGGQAEWCKNDLDNLINQRKELEASLNEEFVRWFFEKYLANSAEDWEQQVSGIFELYWKDVDISREMAHRMNCLDKNEFDFTPSLINIKYETEFGKLEFWEEIKIAKVPGLDKEMKLLSPYMKIWIFPPKEFIKYEMKQSMKKHEFPGPPEEKLEREEQEGLTEEEKTEIKKDKNVMKKIKELSDKYNGNVDVAVQFKDYATNEIVFNLYAQMNENDILKIEPMPPEELPQKDVTIEMDFEKLFDIIYTSEKEMRGEELESPPWDKKPRRNKVGEIFDGAKMYLKVRSMINNAKIYPESEEKTARRMIKEFFSMMDKKEMKGPPEDKGELENKEMFEDGKKGGKQDKIGKPGKDKKPSSWDDKEVLTGEIILEE